MPTQITQTDSDGRSYLRVEGEMLLDDALLIERIANEIREDSDREVVVDLADLDFLDSDSAEVLRRLESGGINLQGTEIFVQSAIDLAERTAN
jgi:anti-anti-sigma regulatory factor